MAEEAKALSRKRTVTVLMRDTAGRMSIIADRSEIECDDDMVGVHSLIEPHKASASSIIVLSAMDTPLFTWDAQ